MAPYLVWTACAVALVLAELVTTTFYVITLAAGCFAAAAVAWAQGDIWLQFLVFLIATALSLLFVSRFRRKSVASANERLGDLASGSLDIGQEIAVSSWEAGGRARVDYRGTQWDAELLDGENANAKNYQIAEIRGSVLLLKVREEATKHASDAAVTQR